jgi:hypothetical protein
MLTILVGVVSKGAGLVINSSMVVFIRTAGQIIASRHRPPKMVIGVQGHFSHHTGAQTPRVHRHLSILSLATMEVEHDSGLIAIKHRQAMVIPTAQVTNLLVTAEVAVLDPALLYQMTAAHAHGVPLLQVDKYHNGRTLITGPRPRHLHRQHQPQSPHVHP